MGEITFVACFSQQTATFFPSIHWLQSFHCPRESIVAARPQVSLGRKFLMRCYCLAKIELSHHNNFHSVPVSADFDSDRLVSVRLGEVPRETVSFTSENRGCR